MKLRDTYVLEVLRNDDTKLFLTDKLEATTSSLTSSEGSKFSFLENADKVKIDLFFDFDYDDFGSWLRSSNEELFKILDKETLKGYTKKKSWTYAARRTFAFLRAKTMPSYGRLSIVLDLSRKSDKKVDIKLDRINVFARWEFRDIVKSEKTLSAISLAFHKNVREEVVKSLYANTLLKTLIQKVEEKIEDPMLMEEIIITFKNKMEHLGAL